MTAQGWVPNNSRWLIFVPCSNPYHSSLWVVFVAWFIVSDGSCVEVTHHVDWPLQWLKWVNIKKDGASVQHVLQGTWFAGYRPCVMCLLGCFSSILTHSSCIMHMCTFVSVSVACYAQMHDLDVHATAPCLAHATQSVTMVCFVSDKLFRQMLGMYCWRTLSGNS